MIVAIPVKGYFAENCYFYIDDQTKHGFLIDPGAESDTLLNLIIRKGWIIEKILLTHGHFDHIGAANKIRDALGVPVAAHQNSYSYLSDGNMNLSSQCGHPITVKLDWFMNDGDILRLEENPEFSLQVIFTPGHTTDSITLYSEKDRVAFVGDTIFKGNIGSYQYPGGNPQDLMNSIVTKIFTLPDDTVLLSGHSDMTTVGAEKKRYLQD